MRKPFWSTPWISDVERIVIGPIIKIPDSDGIYRSIKFVNAAGSIEFAVHGVTEIAAEISDVDEFYS